MKSLPVLLVTALLLASCATNTGDPDKDARAKSTNAVLAQAAQVLGQLAVNSLLKTAQTEMGSNTDMGHAAAQGVWGQAASWVTSQGIALVINQFSNRTLSKTAAVAKDVFSSSSAQPAQKATAIASVISAAASR